jgi:predicted acyltransferase
MRLPGVLQRIALCYLIAALIYLFLERRARLAVFLGLLAGYWLALMLIPVPGFGPGALGPEGNLPGYIDGRLLAGHLYKPGFDPEGLLSTLPAAATALLGTLAGDLLRSGRTLVRKAAALAGYGVVLGALGLALHPLMPINKQLWTSTFVLFTGGAALSTLGAMLLVIELFRLRAWAYPLTALGSNAIAVFVLSTLTTKTLIWIKVGSGAGRQSLYAWVYRNVFASWAGAELGSLAFALAAVVLWTLFVIPLYRKRIFIRI